MKNWYIVQSYSSFEKKVANTILENIKSLQLSPSVLEILVQKHYIENKKIISLEGNLLRLAIDNKISRNEFIKFYIGNEINPNLKKFLDTNPLWKEFFSKNKEQSIYKSERNKCLKNILIDYGNEKKILKNYMKFYSKF